MHLPLPLRFFAVLGLTCALQGCVNTGHDSNTRVFHTREQVALERAQLQRQAAVKMAVSVLKFDRPDIDVHPSGNFAVALALDNTTRIVDLTPIGDEVIKTDDQRPIVRKFLAKELVTFDRDCVIALGPKIMGRAEPWLVNRKRLEALSASAKAAGGSDSLISTHVVTELYWVPVISMGNGASRVPIDKDLLAATGLSEGGLTRAAMENLDKTLPAVADSLYTVIDFPAIGRSGHLKPGINPAVVLSPHFVKMVRDDWKTEDNLVIFVPSSSSVVFVERGKEKLLDKLVPQWQHLITSLADPLCDSFLVVGGERPELLAYVPTTQVFIAPTSKPSTRQVYVR